MPTPHTDHALALAGPDQFVAVGSVEALGLAGKDFTVEAWIKLQSPRLDGQDLTILGGETPARNAGLHLLVRNGRLYFGCWDNDTPGNTTLAPGVWYHVAFRYTADGGEQALLLNGVLDAAGGGHAPFAGAGAVFIGRSFAARPLNGLVTEVRVWGEARSEAQIQASMFARLGGHEANLTAYWPLDDATGALARDARTPIDRATGQALPDAGARLPGEIRGGTWVASDAPLAASAAEARVVAARFDGVDSHIAVADRATLALADALTIEAWCNPAATLGSGKPVSAYPVASKHGAASGWELRVGNGQCAVMVTVNKVHQQALTAGLSAGLWYHVAGVYDGQMLRLYLNGVLKTSIAVSGAITQYPDVLSLGRNSYWPERVFAGQLAEVRLWSRARSQAELQAAMYARLGGQEAGLVGWWRLEGDAADASVNRHGGAQRAIRWESTGVPLPASGAAGLLVTSEEGDSAKLRDELAQRNQDVRALTEALQRSTAQIDELKRTAVGLGQLNNQLTERVAALQRQLEAQAQLDRQVVAKQAEIDALNARVAELAKAGGAQTMLEDFVKNANDEITRARDQLKRQGSDYSLGKVTLQVKMLPGPGGVGMQFPAIDRISTLDAEHLSSLSLEFESQEAKDVPRTPLVTVPSVLDYTEVLARRKLADANFLVDVNYQAVTLVPGEPIQVDRVVGQFPNPGADAPSGSTVRIFIGRQS